MSAAPIVEVESLSKYYSGHRAVDGVTFQIGRGEIVGFLGPNGAGKTTTLRILATYQPATSGTVRIAGHDVFREPQTVQKTLGYMPEHNPLPLELRVREYLSFRASIRQLKDRKRVDEVIDQCGLEEVSRRIIGQLSKGYRQRVGLAEALIHRPQLVILDEPTTGLDPNQIRSVRELIKSLAPETTILLSSHILPEIELTCDRVLILNRGRLLADESTTTLQAKFHAQADVIAELKGDPEKIKNALAVLPGLKKVVTRSMSASFTEYKLQGASKEDWRPLIATIAQQEGWALRELHRREYSLEEIFSQLTESANAA